MTSGKLEVFFVGFFLGMVGMGLLAINDRDTLFTRQGEAIICGEINWQTPTCDKRKKERLEP